MSVCFLDLTLKGPQEKQMQQTPLSALYGGTDPERESLLGH